MNQLKSRERKQQHFDITASVHLMRHDLEVHGAVLPETLERVYDEELTFLAEGINRPLYTEFVLKNIDGELAYFSEGQWTPYQQTLIKGLESAKEEAAHDPRKQILVDMAERDLLVGYQFGKLETGQKMHWYSPYPEKVERLYGQDFVQSLGFQPKRNMGFMYEAEKASDGSLIMRTQSLDNSDDEAFMRAIEVAEAGVSIKDATKAYDTVLSEKHGRKFRYGREELFANEENAWSIIKQNSDLIEYFMNGIEELAQSNLSDTTLKQAKEDLTYGVWAALKQRLDREAGMHRWSGDCVAGGSLQAEINGAFTDFKARGETLITCGGSLTSSADSSNPADVLSSIFGNQEERLPAYMNCINCRTRVPSSKVVKSKSWCCPACKYEVDICTGEVRNKGKIKTHQKPKHPWVMAKKEKDKKHREPKRRLGHGRSAHERHKKQ